MKSAIKSLVLASCLAGLSACSSTGKIDYDDSVETPDVLLEDAQGGDSDYGLDKNAARNNQQNKPDGLVQSTSSSSTASAPSNRNTNDNRSSSGDTQTVETKAESQPKEQKRVVKVKTAKKTKPKKPKKQPSREESALEVDDPLLGEIDPQ